MDKDDYAMPDLTFPKNATKKERKFNWPLIAEISDQDFGYIDLIQKSHKVKFNTRCLLKRKDGKICIIKSEKYNYTQIPGGGIEKDETIEAGLKREIKEETGWIIKNIRPIGVVIEHRKSAQNQHPWTKCFSFTFVAEPLKKVGTKYMPDEIDEGFVPIWVDPGELLEAKTKLLKDPTFDSYSGHFSNYRDLLILRFTSKN